MRGAYAWLLFLVAVLMGRFVSWSGGVGTVSGSSSSGRVSGGTVSMPWNVPGAGAGGANVYLDEQGRIRLRGRTGVYDPKTGKWVGRTRPANAIYLAKGASITHQGRTITATKSGWYLPGGGYLGETGTEHISGEPGVAVVSPVKDEALPSLREEPVAPEPTAPVTPSPPSAQERYRHALEAYGGAIARREMGLETTRDVAILGIGGYLAAKHAIPQAEIIKGEKTIRKEIEPGMIAVSVQPIEAGKFSGTLAEMGFEVEPGTDVSKETVFILPATTKPKLEMEGFKPKSYLEEKQKMVQVQFKPWTIEPLAPPPLTPEQAVMKAQLAPAVPSAAVAREARKLGLGQEVATKRAAKAAFEYQEWQREHPIQAAVFGEESPFSPKRMEEAQFAMEYKVSPERTLSGMAMGFGATVAGLTAFTLEAPGRIATGGVESAKQIGGELVEGTLGVLGQTRQVLSGDARAAMPLAVTLAGMYVFGKGVQKISKKTGVSAKFQETRYEAFERTGKAIEQTGTRLKKIGTKEMVVGKTVRRGFVQRKMMPEPPVPEPRTISSQLREAGRTTIGLTRERVGKKAIAAGAGLEVTGRRIKELGLPTLKWEVTEVARLKVGKTAKLAETPEGFGLVEARHLEPTGVTYRKWTTDIRPEKIPYEGKVDFRTSTLVFGKEGLRQFLEKGTGTIRRGLGEELVTAEDLGAYGQYRMGVATPRGLRRVTPLALPSTHEVVAAPDLAGIKPFGKPSKVRFALREEFAKQVPREPDLKPLEAPKKQAFLELRPTPGEVTTQFTPKEVFRAFEKAGKAVAIRATVVEETILKFPREGEGLIKLQEAIIAKKPRGDLFYGTKRKPPKKPAKPIKPFEPPAAPRKLPEIKELDFMKPTKVARRGRGGQVSYQEALQIQKQINKELGFGKKVAKVQVVEGLAEVLGYEPIREIAEMKSISLAKYAGVTAVKPKMPSLLAERPLAKEAMVERLMPADITQLKPTEVTRVRPVSLTVAKARPAMIELPMTMLMPKTVAVPKQTQVQLQRLQELQIQLTVPGIDIPRYTIEPPPPPPVFVPIWGGAALPGKVSKAKKFKQPKQYKHSLLGAILQIKIKKPPKKILTGVEIRGVVKGKPKKVSSKVLFGGKGFGKKFLFGAFKWV